MMDYYEAVKALKVRQLAAEAENAAISTLLTELARYRKALHYYADPKNWLDGSPMLDAFAREDNGLTAQVALRRIDLIGDPVIVKEVQGEDAAGNSSAA